MVVQEQQQGAGQRQGQGQGQQQEQGWWGQRQRQVTVARVREKIDGMVVLPPQQFRTIPSPDQAAVCTCTCSTVPRSAAGQNGRCGNTTAANGMAAITRTLVANTRESARTCAPRICPIW